MRDNGRADTDRTPGGTSVRDHDGGGGKPSLSVRQCAVLVAALVVLIDQLTKAWASTALADGPIVLIENFLQFRLTHNTGAAFSLFSSGGPLIGVVAAGVAVLIMFVLNDTSHRGEAIALGMVLGGSLGNLIDRMMRGDGFLNGAVVDFIDFDFFATFNVADMGITLGVVLLLVVALFHRP